jgi:uncharacterized protein (TIGR01319 family)
MPEKEIKSVLITDCGSTTTKAILIEKIGDEYRQTIRGEAPTTVEAPFDDVTLGVLNSVTEVEELSENHPLGLVPRTIINRETGRLIHPEREENGRKIGVDLYLSTSSAGGGLQMSVTGIVRKMTAESAQRAALGAGAIVMDVISIDDGRKPHERVARLRSKRPDIVLLAGGTDGQNIRHPVELAQTILSADPRPRFGATFRLPIIYAGNKNAADEVQTLLKDKFDVQIVPNIRPRLEEENRQPSQEAIHECFLKHVMSQAPGYDKLMEWVHASIMPTPHAMGEIVKTISEQEDIDILAVDIGGATTDVFSMFYPREAKEKQSDAPRVFNRTVSANLGMSYSICNVLLEAGIDNIVRWLPFELDAAEIKNRMRNKMIRPTTIPQTREDLVLEHCVAREALRLAFRHHSELAVGLKGIQTEGDVSRTFEQTGTGQTLIDMMSLRMIVGSGGVLSHAPSRNQAALMLVDAFQPEGITLLAVDSIFMMPHLGVFAQVHPEGASHVFKRDCLIYLGTSIVPSGLAKREGDSVAEIHIDMPDGEKPIDLSLKYGDVRVFPLATGKEAMAKIRPHGRFDVGAGKGRDIEQKLLGGLTGIVIDGRGRPYIPSPTSPNQIANNAKYLDAFGIGMNASYERKR